MTQEQSNMDLEERKEKGLESDRKLDASMLLNREPLPAPKPNEARPALLRQAKSMVQEAVHRLAKGLASEVVLALAAMGTLGSFIYDNREQGRYVFPAVVLELFAIAVLIALLRQITAARQIAYDKPVTTIQKQLETLWKLRIRYTQRILLTAPLAWTPFLIVVLKGFFGLDAYRLFGVAIIPLAIWLSRRFGGRWPIFQRFMGDQAGHNLEAATDFLATLS